MVARIRPAVELQRPCSASKWNKYRKYRRYLDPRSTTMARLQQVTVANAAAAVNFDLIMTCRCSELSRDLTTASTVIMPLVGRLKHTAWHTASKSLVQVTVEPSCVGSATCGDTEYTLCSYIRALLQSKNSQKSSSSIRLRTLWHQPRPCLLG